MAGDRDLGVSLVRAWAGLAGGRTGWEVTAATGVRGLRLVRESAAFDRFLLTEANPTAAEVLRRNAGRVAGAVAVERDGRGLPGEAPFDYVDVDPYGSPVPFLGTALRAVRPGGLLAVTATDMMVLAGVQPGAAEARYGARPVRGRLGPEGGLRILLGYLAHQARSLGRRVRPVLAYVRDHHVRAYVEVTEGGEDTPGPIAAIVPAFWHGPRLGERGPYGPLWLGPLFDASLVRRLEVPTAAAEPRSTATFLDRVREELAADVPFYYEPNELSRALGLASPPSRAALFERLRDRGYRAARTHARAEGFRTDAPREEVEAAARALAPGGRREGLAGASVSPRTPGSGRSSAPPAGSP